MPKEAAWKRVRNREILSGPWHFTDDTVMAIGIYRILEKYGKIDQDELAKVFARNYALDWHRGYGGTAHSILRSIGEGKDWREVASALLLNKISSAVSIPKKSGTDFVVSVLGNGMSLTAQDTVPFCVWCAAYFYASMEEAL